MIVDEDFDNNWSDEEDETFYRCEQAPGDEALHESGAGGESALVAEAESLVRGYVLLDGSSFMLFNSS